LFLSPLMCDPDPTFTPHPCPESKTKPG
jgi:hypothetical protein